MPVNRLNIASGSVLLLLALPASAVRADDGAAADGETDTQEVPAEQAAKAPAAAYPRRVYKVDDVGMIIGGASEDAKAKVRRLPVQK